MIMMCCMKRSDKWGKREEDTRALSMIWYDGYLIPWGLDDYYGA